MMTPESFDPREALSAGERSTAPARTIPVTHQTVKLSGGRHRGPEEGACVMELASMLAGEPFSDHPLSVCPVIGSLLRAYNDSVDDDRRQDLYAYAANVVGSRSSDEVQRARAERLAAWASERQRRRWTRFFMSPALRSTRLQRQRPVDALGIHAVDAISRHTDQTHAEVLALIDELLAIDLGEEPPGRPGAVAPQFGAASAQSVGNSC
jgi:hypothetical protein